MNIEVKDQINQESYEEIVDLLVKYNSSKRQPLDQEINKPIEIIIRNSRKEIIGGLYGRSHWGTLEIKTFVVKAEYRNKGIGNKLLREAEQEALKRKCRFINLDTFSFQAPGFYEKNGFEKIGTESDFPKGFDKYYYRKLL